jgi:glycosyltransferase involved in cell wall biosynthesis
MLSALKTLRQLVQSIRPDLIQGWMYHGNLAASAAGSFSSHHPAVCWNVRHSLHDLGHEKAMTRWVIRAGRQLSSQPEAIIYNSSVSRTQHEHFGFASTRARVIPNGFNCSDLFPDVKVKARVRRTLDIPTEAVVVGHVARHHPMKGHQNFLSAAAQVAAQSPHAHFVLVGRDVHPNHSHFQGLVPSELRQRFHFLGERDDIPDLLRTMDVLCSSSLWGEGFPNVIGEAMASGVPCVATDVGDSAFVVGETGWVVPPQDTVGVVEALNVALAELNDPVAWSARCDTARSRIQQHFTLDQVVKSYTTLWREVLER